MLKENGFKFVLFVSVLIASLNYSYNLEAQSHNITPIINLYKIIQQNPLCQALKNAKASGLILDKKVLKNIKSKINKKDKKFLRAYIKFSRIGLAALKACKKLPKDYQPIDETPTITPPNPTLAPPLHQPTPIETIAPLPVPPIPDSGTPFSSLFGTEGSVVIEEEQEVYLDAPLFNLTNLTIKGTLRCGSTDTRVNTDWVMVTPTGKFECGTSANPFTKNLHIHLSDKTPNENIMNMGDKLFGVMGGTLELHGKPKTTWMQLDKTANAGDTNLHLTSIPSGWTVGDEIVIAPTDFDPFEAEVRKITSLDGNVVNLNQPLEFKHFGEISTTQGEPIDMRGEVGNLTRNIKIDAKVNGDKNMQGGHTMYMPNSNIKIEYTNFDNLGQAGNLGRYPIHFHLAFDTIKNAYIRGNSITNSKQRGIVIHQTDGILVEDNVVYNAHGNMYYLEDGYENDNKFINNLGILMRHVTNEFRLSRPSQENDKRQDKGSAFWITNYNNTVIGNHVAGVEHGWGFIYAPPAHGQSETPRKKADKFNYGMPKRGGMQEMSNNIAHTVSHEQKFGSFNLGYGPEEAGSCIRFDLRPYKDEHGQLSGSIPVSNLTAYNCSNAAYWGGIVHLARNWRSAQSRLGFVCNQGKGERGKKENFIFVGETNSNVSGRNLDKFLTSGPFLGMAGIQNTKCSITDKEKFKLIGIPLKK